MTVYRFRVIKKWYAYALLKDAESARTYFLHSNYPLEMVSEIEQSDERDFQFKMNSISDQRVLG